MMALAEDRAEPRRSLLQLSALPVTEGLGPFVMADDPCLAASWPADPTGASKYYRARYYDPKTGRFISEDPIGFAGGVNFYAYVNNRPTVLTDPFGLTSEDPTFGFPKTFWNWFHRMVKQAGDADLTKDEASQLYKEWKRLGKPGPDHKGFRGSRGRGWGRGSSAMICNRFDEERARQEIQKVIKELEMEEFIREVIEGLE